MKSVKDLLYIDRQLLSVKGGDEEIRIDIMKYLVNNYGRTIAKRNIHLKKYVD